MDGFLEALKWVLIVLLAGFIGQFGKSLSTHVIDYLKKENPGQQQVPALSMPGMPQRAAAGARTGIKKRSRRG